MDQREALRIIQNVASHNPHDVPMPSQVVAAAASMVDRARWEQRLLCSGLDLIGTAARVTEAIKKHVFHEHPLMSVELIYLLQQVRLACQDVEMTISEGPTQGPTPNTVLNQGVDS